MPNYHEVLKFPPFWHNHNSSSDIDAGFGLCIIIIEWFKYMYLVQNNSEVAQSNTFNVLTPPAPRISGARGCSVVKGK